MLNADIIKSYFETFFSGMVQPASVRTWLTDDFHFRGPLMSANSADEYVQQLQTFGDEIEMYPEVRILVAA